MTIINKFESKNFFHMVEDARVPSQPQSAIYLHPEGAELVLQYYAKKYQMIGVEILQAPKNIDIFTVPSKRFYHLIEKLNSEEFKKLKKDASDMRLAWFNMSEGHTTPVIYVKENGKECLLVFDTGFVTHDFIEVLSSRVNLPVYTLMQPRQRDQISCNADALVFLRELMGKNKNGKFLIPKIMDQLNPQPTEYQNLYFVDIPHQRLLKTAEHRQFVKYYKKGDEPIHSHGTTLESYNDFIKRYPPHAVIAGKEEAADMSNYIIEKGHKYAHMIEIQFYLNELKSALGTDYTDVVRAQFIHDAKEQFKNEGQKDKGLFELAQKYANNRQPSEQTSADTADTQKSVTKPKIGD